MIADDLKVLRKARALIANPNNWIKGNFATDAGGNMVHPEDPPALCFCTMGAVRRARVDLLRTSEIVYGPLNAACWLGDWIDKHHPNIWGIACFNDAEDTTHADVLRMFDETIADLEKGAP
jgi:hypothetical protein